MAESIANPRYLLDTNILSAAIKNPGGPVTERLRGLSGDDVCTSIVVASELRFGAVWRDSAVLTAKVDSLLASILVLPLEAGVDEHYADIRASLAKAGTPIGQNDLFIAAHVRALGLMLVTDNVREFERVPELKLENWLDPAAPSS